MHYWLSNFRQQNKSLAYTNSLKSCRVESNSGGCELARTRTIFEIIHKNKVLRLQVRKQFWWLWTGKNKNYFWNYSQEQGFAITSTCF